MNDHTGPAVEGAAFSGVPQPTTGFAHCVALGKLLNPQRPGFDKRSVGVVIAKGGVLTVGHGGCQPSVAFGAYLPSVIEAYTGEVDYCPPPHAQADALVEVLINEALATKCEMATTSEFQAARAGILVGFDANGQRIAQDLEIINCPAVQVQPWEFLAAATTSSMRTIVPSDSGSPFYILTTGGLRAAGLLVRELDTTACPPGARFTRIDYVRDWALALPVFNPPGDR